MAQLLSIDVTASGIFAIAATNRGPVLFLRIGRKIGKEVWEEWIAKKGLPGLSGHFNATYSGQLGYSDRGRAYMKRKRRVNGRNDPYVGPRPLSKNKPGGTHMRELIKQPGSGYRVQAVRDTQRIIVKAIFPGARQLNWIKRPWGDLYRTEFLRLNHPTYGKIDRDWMLARFAEKFWPAFNEAMAREQAVTLKARSRLITLAGAA